jgi:hypothetical protein
MRLNDKLLFGWETLLKFILGKFARAGMAN